jgi:hypothetical protein
MLEPYAMKVARTVLRGGKIERSYLSQFDTLLVHTLNNECRKNLINKFLFQAYALTFHLGSTRATLKPKRIDDLSNQQ